MSTTNFGEEKITPSRAEQLCTELSILHAGLAERSILVSLECVAALDPDYIAITDGAQTLSRVELLGKARRVAAALVRCGLPPGPIGLLLPDGAAHVVALLGFLGAGRLFMPLDYTAPQDALTAAARACRLVALLVRAVDAVKAETMGLPGVIFEGCLGEDESALPEVDPSAPAVIVSTSGTTGAPKAVVHAQRNLVETVAHMVELTEMGPSDVCLSIAPSHTKASLNQRLDVLLSGATLLLSDIQVGGLGGVLADMEREHASILRATPMVMKTIVRMAGAEASLAALRMIYLGGDLLLRQDLTDIVAALPPGCRVYATLNSAEVRIADWVVDPAAVDDPVRIAGGWPRQEASIRLLDESGEAAPDDVGGELVVHSRSAALGDWIEGRLVKDRFPQDPEDPRRRIVRTGDLARRTPEGRIVVIGRKDRMVKIRGHRVEPALVEAALLRVPGVSYASVQVQRDGTDARLFGFVVPEPGAIELATTVAQAARAALPEYMRPVRIIEIDALPLAPSGKIDSIALLQIAKLETEHSSSKQTAPSRASAIADRAVAIAWRRVLGRMPRPGIAFRDAAGDSLRLLELVFDLESRTGRRLPLDAFNVEASADEMALALDAALRNPGLPRTNNGVFLLPGARGDTPGLAGLRADCLAVTAIEMLTYPDWREMLRTGPPMESILESVVRQIRSLSRTGPICLIGYSFGAYVTILACHILEGEGREVAQAILIDMPPPHRRKRPMSSPSAPAMVRAAWWEADQLRRAVRQGMAAERFGMIAATLAKRIVRRPGVRTLAMSRAAEGWSRSLGDFGYWVHHHLGMEFRLQATREWELRWRPPAEKLRAPLLLIRSEEHGQDTAEDLGWSELAKQVSVARVPGAHASMLSAPHRKAVSETVSAALAQALSMRSSESA